MDKNKEMKIVSIVGARPQFIKLAPLARAVQKHNKSNSKYKIKHLIIHTGQHYDYEMNKIFFDELSIQEPDYNLGVGSGSHGWQTGKIMERAEDVLKKVKPNWVLVYGDTNSTLGGAVAATKLHIPVVHIEAGLRSYNKKMPEEINRVLTDHCSNILFCPTENAVTHLKKEGFTNILNNGKLINSSSYKLTPANFRFPIVINAGDIMYDTLLICLEIEERKSTILEKLKLKPKEYYLATIHRPENTDNKDTLRNIIEALIEISKYRRVIFPIHPRTKKKLETFHIIPLDFNQLHLLDPISYFDMLIIEKNAKQILTDSGGMQKEAYILKVPCITLRNETEWIETVESGWNILIETADKNILKTIEHILKKNQDASFFSNKDSKKPDYYGNGDTACQIIRLLTHFTENLV